MPPDLEARESLRECHYCPGLGKTRDHIVPRCLVRELARLVDMSDMYGKNTVHACESCNQAKGHGRGSCICERCVQAWNLYWSKVDSLQVWEVYRIKRSRPDFPAVAA